MSTQNHPKHVSSINLPTRDLSAACPAPKFEFFTGILFCILLVLAYPIARILPPTWAWENGVLEWIQVFILSCALVIAFWYDKKAPTRYLARFWFYQLPIWLIMLGRETSWGAAFFPYRAINDHGPVLVSVKSLWYGPAVYPLLGLLFIFTIFQIIRHRLYRIPLSLLRARRFPLLTLSLSFLGIILASCFEQEMISLPNVLNQSLEEYLEAIFYLGLIVTDIGIHLQTRANQPLDNQYK